MLNRIEIPTHYDLWMRGARFGEVVSRRKDGSWMVSMDHPQVRRHVRVPLADQEFCKILNGRLDAHG